MADLQTLADDIRETNELNSYMKPANGLDIFRLGDDKELTDELLLGFIHKNDDKTQRRYNKLWRAYNGDYKIYHQKRKEKWMPDARAGVNFARVIVDTFEGFFMGIPVKVTSDNESDAEYLDELEAQTDGDDINAELSNIVSIFGRGYRICYVDEYGEIGTAYIDPREGFAIYNRSITPRMRFFVRTYEDDDGKRQGSISDDAFVRYFTVEGDKITWGESYAHGFSSVPAVEVVQNRARRGIFEDVLPLIDFMNKTLSDKMNDISALASNIIKIIGPKFNKTQLDALRYYHILNVETRDATSAVVDYLIPPNGDSSQEHLLDRLERLIFQIAMVCNIQDDTFAASSGIAIRWKMSPMVNLATNKWRKYEHGLKQYYKLVCSNPVVPMDENAWTQFKYVHILNYPINLAEEADVAAKLTGIASHESQLSVLSFIDDPKDELERIRKERQSDMEVITGGYSTKRVVDETVTKEDEVIETPSEQIE